MKTIWILLTLCVVGCGKEKKNESYFVGMPPGVERSGRGAEGDTIVSEWVVMPKYDSVRVKYLDKRMHDAIDNINKRGKDFDYFGDWRIGDTLIFNPSNPPRTAFNMDRRFVIELIAYENGFHFLVSIHGSYRLNGDTVDTFSQLESGGVHLRTHIASWSEDYGIFFENFLNPMALERRRIKTVAERKQEFKKRYLNK